MLCRPWVVLCRPLGRAPIAGSRWISFRLLFLERAWIFPTMFSSGNVGGQKSTLSLLDHYILLFQSISTCSCLLKGSSNPLLWPIYIRKQWSATTKEVPLLPLGGSSLPAGQPPLDHSHAFCKSCQIGHAEFTKRSQRSRTVNTNVEAKAELNTQVGAELQQSGSKTLNFLVQRYPI